MARPQTVVKNQLSLAIVELRRRLGYSQQAFSNFLGLSLNSIARWELNSRPAPEMLKRLIEIAMEHGYSDLEDVLYAEYQAEFGLKLRSNFTHEIDALIDFALLTNDVQQMRSVLRGIRKKLKAEFPGEPVVFRPREDGRVEVLMKPPLTTLPQKEKVKKK
jgi:transcriptional regulator with XRE-family HTH domain